MNSKQSHVVLSGIQWTRIFEIFFSNGSIQDKLNRIRKSKCLWIIIETLKFCWPILFNFGSTYLWRHFFFDATQLEGHRHKVLSEIFFTLNYESLSALWFIVGGNKSGFQAIGMDWLQYKELTQLLPEAELGTLDITEAFCPSFRKISLYRFNGEKTNISKFIL